MSPAPGAHRTDMGTYAERPAEPRRRSMFQLFALYVIASQAINLPERFLPIFMRHFDSVNILHTSFLLLVVVTVCVALRSRRDAIVRSDLAPFYAVLTFAFLLPYLRQLLSDALMGAVLLFMTGQIGPTREFDSYLAREPLRMIWQVLLGVGATVIWHLALKGIFGADAQRVVPRGIAPARGFWLTVPLLFCVIALPWTVIGGWVRDACARVAAWPARLAQT